MQRYKVLAVSLVLLTFVLSGLVLAKPVNRGQVEKAVKGWLKTDDKPLGESLGKQIAWTDVYNGTDGQPAYYIVYLNPSGFVIVSADDLVEPVVGFVPGTGLYNLSPESHLAALVSRDLPGRIDTARELQNEFDAKVKKKNLTAEESEMRDAAVKANGKWNKLQAYADESLPAPTAGLGTVSDMRVAPIVQSKWDQYNVCGDWCYNYYTPNHWYSGCVATAMAQVIRNRQWPADGTYNWSLMPLVPDCTITTEQRQAIGRLCSDTGIAADSHYGSGGTGATSIAAKNGLINTFHYSNAVMGGTAYSNIGDGLPGMMNPTIDAGWPVILQIYPSGCHEVVGDGYGYNSGTLYHHINMGWSGDEDAWYNLPNITSKPGFTSVEACIYNLYTSGDGEIISGRVLYSSGTPYFGATVTATGPSGPYTGTTNENGIYAIVHVRSASTYTITVSAPGCSSFTPASQSAATGTSTDYALTSGDVWGINFTTTCTPPAPPSPPATISYPTSNNTGQYTVSWSSVSGAMLYKLERSSDGGSNWTQVYSGANLSYLESIGNGSYRYRVKATNGGGSSGWTTGTWDCVVSPPVPPTPPASITYPASNGIGQYTVSWASSSGATSYQLARSSDGGSNWTQIYDGASISYADTVSNGSYRYRVKAKNSGGESAWTTGTFDCAVCIPPPLAVQFLAGTPAGWDFYELAGDIARNNTVDLSDLNIIAQHWLDSNCATVNQWCSGADIDDSNGVDLLDYAMLTNDWSKQAGENVLLQTIYGTAQNSSGTITANGNRAMSLNKGMAMAFSVPQTIILDKGIFKMVGVKGSEGLRIRLYDVTGKGYLTCNHSITKADPATGGTVLVDTTVISPSTVPYHSEGTGTSKYTDMVVNFGPLELPAGEYLIVFDGAGPSNTGYSIVRGISTDIANMGKYPDGSPLPKRATVTTSATTGNTYHYQLGATSDTSYTAISNLFAFQMTTIANHAPVVDAGADQQIYLPSGANLDGTVTDNDPVSPCGQTGQLTTLWLQQSGPDTAIFDNPTAVDTVVTFPVPGEYVLRLTASDGSLSAYDEVTVTVQ